MASARSNGSDCNEDSNWQEDPPRRVIYTKTVDVEGNCWLDEETGVVIYFPPEAVSKPKVITCSLWNSSVVSPPLEDNEASVSNVLELACDDPDGINFSDITVALSHSGTDLGGYELVMKELIDSENKTWKDLESTEFSDLVTLVGLREGVITWSQFKLLEEYLKYYWEDLGEALELEAGILHNIEVGEFREIPQVLSEWMNKKGSDASVGILVDALEKMGKRPIAEKIIDLESESELPFLEGKVTSFSLYAVICRLKSYTFASDTSVRNENFTCQVPEYPDLSVTIPGRSLSKDLTLTIKVQQLSDDDSKEGGVFVGPILHVSCSLEVELKEPATISIPITLEQESLNLSSTHVRIFYCDTRENSREWVEITRELQTPAKLENGVVTFQVNHFSKYLVTLTDSSKKINIQRCVKRKRVSSVPQLAGFLACLCDIGDPERVEHLLVLCCFPLNIRNKVWKEVSSRYNVVRQGQDTSHHLLCKNDHAFFNLPDGFIQKSDKETNFLMFNGKAHFETCVPVRIERTESCPQIRFFKQNGHETTLCNCTLPINSTISYQIDQLSISQDTSGDFAELLKRRTDLVTEEQILKIQDEVGACWKRLGIILGIEPAKVRNLEQDCALSSERAYKVLEIWMHKIGSEATVGRLACALITIEERSIAEKLLGLDYSPDKQHRSMLMELKVKKRRTRNDGKEAVRQLTETKLARSRDITREETPRKRTFTYTNDFDKKGVIYYLGRVPPPGRGWQNPAEKDAEGKSRTGLTVGRSTGGIGKAEVLLEYFKPEPSCTGDKSTPWWGIDFGEKYALLLSNYTLRHGRADGKHQLTDWKIEGKPNGPLDSEDDWTILKEHSGEVWGSLAIPRPFMTKTWRIENVKGPFRCFRIVQLKQKRLNTNVRIYLAGLELYGDLYET